MAHKSSFLALKISVQLTNLPTPRNLPDFWGWEIEHRNIGGLPKEILHSQTVTSTVKYDLTGTQSFRIEHSLWTTLDRAVGDVPKHEKLFVLMDAQRPLGEEEEWGG